MQSHPCDNSLKQCRGCHRGDFVAAVAKRFAIPVNRCILSPNTELKFFCSLLNSVGQAVIINHNIINKSNNSERIPQQIMKVYLQ